MFVNMSPDMKWVATGTWHGEGIGDDRVRIWDARTGELVRALPVPMDANVAFSPDNRWLVSSSPHDYRFWEVGTWQTRQVLPRESSRFGVIAFSPDARIMAISHRRVGTRLVDVATGVELATFDDVGIESPLGFSPDGGLLATVGQNDTIRLWDLRLIRNQLKSMGLDWPEPSLPPLTKLLKRLELVPPESATRMPATRPAGLVADEKAFAAQTTVYLAERFISINQPPSAATARHLGRLPGEWTIEFNCDPQLASTKNLRGMNLKNVIGLRVRFRQHLNELFKELVRPESGLTAIKTLDLMSLPVTDADLKVLAGPGGGLKNLEALDLTGTFKVTDAGLVEIARPDTGLTRLTTLTLDSMQITAVGLEAFARPNSGIQNLTTLDLKGSRVADAGVILMARPDTALKTLRKLDLTTTKVTDAGLHVIASANTGLRNLTELTLVDNHITDAGVRDLARADTGLKELDSLDLQETDLTDTGLKTMAAPDTGLVRLTTLSLVYDAVTDAGLAELARPDSGLKSLTSLDLQDTKVTDAGLKALMSAGNGLKALTSFGLIETSVTNAGVRALQHARPTLEVYR